MILKQRPIFFATVLKSPDVAGNFIVVVLASTSHEKIEIGAGDAQSTSAKPVSVSSDQANRKSTDEADVAICKQEATSINVGDAECSKHESDSASLSETLSQSPAVNDTGTVGSDSANVSHNVRSHRKLKAEKGTGGDENSKRMKSEETCEQKLMNADRDSENKAAQSDRSMQNRTSDTSDVASEGSSNPEVSTYCIFDTAQCCKTSTFIQ